MEEFFAGLGGFIIIAIFIIGIIAGIYFKIKDNVIDPKNKKAKDKAIAEFKYAEFLAAVNTLSKHGTINQADENGVKVVEDISNGVEKIGEFQYIIQDIMEMESNSIGTIKLHNYVITVMGNVIGYGAIKRSSPKLKSLSEQECLKILRELKGIIQQHVSFKDALRIKQIK